MMRRRGILLMAVAATVACSETDAESGWTAVRDTLPGGAVRVVNTPGASGADATWRLETALHIGSVDQPGPTQFGAIKGIAVLPDGRIAVLDQMAREVRIFGADGAHLATYGGEGEGPGEFREPYGLMLAPDGRLLVPDHSNDRMNVVDPDAGFVTSHPFTVLSFGYTWSGAMGVDGRIFEPTITLGPPRRNIVKVYGPDMVAVDSLPLPDPPASDPTNSPSSFYWEAPGGRGFGYISVPFYPRGQRRIAADGAVWTSDAAYRIKRWLPGGDTTLVIESTRPLLAVTPAERDSAIAAIRTQLEARGAGNQDWSKIPSSKPPVLALLLSDEGDVWVQTSAPAGASLFDVFASDGTHRRTITTDLTIVAHITPVIRGDTIWAVVRDDMDVQHVVKARVTPVPDAD